MTTHEFLNGTNPNYLTSRWVAVYFESSITNGLIKIDSRIELSDAKNKIISGAAKVLSEEAILLK